MNPLVISIAPIESGATRLPPFARQVIKAIAQQAARNVRIFSGAGAWKRARIANTARGLGSAMLLPPGELAESYRWPAVEWGVLIVADDRSTAFSLARAVVSNGTPLAFAVFGSSESLIVRSVDFHNPLETAR